MSKLTQLKKPVIIGGITLLGLTGASAFAFQQSSTTGANEVPPIYTQVEEHEGRIDTLETRADTTEAKVEQNTTDIQVIKQEKSGSTGTGSTSSPGAAPAPNASTTTTEPSPTPTPAPEPAPHPRTITAVTSAPAGNGLHACDYTLYDRIEDSRQGTVMQPADRPCHSVGEVLPQY